MSDRTTQREWRFYVDDMIDFAERVITYTVGLNQTDFIASGLNYDATLGNLELIGEAAILAPDDIRQNYSNIPWRLMVAARNRLIHSYLGIDNDTVWSIITVDIPMLLEDPHALKNASN